MKQIKFNELRPDQIEVRPTDTKVQGQATLLLYIDSRSAADILNEAIGELNWQIEYKPVGDKIFGRLSIWDEEKKMWIYKEDTGEESNIAADKGLSSDILKRCLARWGCDYLYHTPRIKIECPDKYYYNGKLCMSFSVKEINFNDDKVCTRLIITDRFGNTVFDWIGDKAKKEMPIPHTDTTPAKKDSNFFTVANEPGRSALTILKEFCDQKKAEEETDQWQLERFFGFWSQKIEKDGWDGIMKPDVLWGNWMSKAYKRTTRNDG